MSRADRRLHILIAIGLAALTFTAFVRVLQADFIMLDDDQYVITNTHIHQGLNAQTIRWALTALKAGTWQPLVWLSYALDYSVWRLNPAGYHLTNVLLHILSAVLLYGVLVRMTGLTWPSAFVAAVFAIHPLRIESVAWIAERKDTLSTFFWMLTMWAYVRYADRPGFLRYLPVLGLYALGLMAKPMLVTMPLVLLLLDYWPLRRIELGVDTRRHKDKRTGPSLAQLIIEKLPLILLATASSVIAFVAQQKAGALSSLERLPVSMRSANVLVSYVKYILMAVWPARLGVLYPRPQDGVPYWQAIAAGALLLLITTAVVRYSRNKPWLGVGWAWYLITLLPVVGIVQVGPHALADRFTYVPHIGLYMIVAWGVSHMFRRARDRTPIRTPTVATPIASLVIITLAGCTFLQTSYWRDSVSLFRRTLAVTRRNPIILNNLASVLIQQGKLKEAQKFLLRARDIKPGARVENNLGIIAESEGDLAAAEERYRAAIDLMPTYPDAHFNLGNILCRCGRFQEAAGEYKKALKLNPEWAPAALGLGQCLAKLGDRAKAITYLEQAIRLDARNAFAHKVLASLLAEAGRTEQAIFHYQQVLRFNPSDTESHINLGTLLGQIGKLDEEIEHYRTALRINPKLPAAHANLAVALYYKGKYSEAWKEVQLCRKYGGAPHPDFMKALMEKLR